MRQITAMMADISGMAEETDVLVEDRNTIFAQEERTVDEICNDGDAEYLEFAGYGTDCCHVHDPCRTSFFGSKKF
ncbi:MAG: hypothetical protein ACOC32_05075 [Nanoarchaeota archaeon]